MEEKLFKIALDYINKHNIKCYNIDICPNAVFTPKIRLQGCFSDNEKLVSDIPFSYDGKYKWYEFINEDISIIITADQWT